METARFPIVSGVNRVCQALARLRHHNHAPHPSSLPLQDPHDLVLRVAARRHARTSQQARVLLILGTGIPCPSPRDCCDGAAFLRRRLSANSCSSRLKSRPVIVLATGGRVCCGEARHRNQDCSEVIDIRLTFPCRTVQKRQSKAPFGVQSPRMKTRQDITPVSVPIVVSP